MGKTGIYIYVFGMLAASPLLAASTDTVKEAAPVETKTEPPSPSAAQLPGVTAPPKHNPNLNEMSGKVLSIGLDPRVLRVTTEGGFNVEFTFDRQTTISSQGTVVAADQLSYGDSVVVRYAGKELNAVEIERTHSSSP